MVYQILLVIAVSNFVLFWHSWGAP